MPSFVRVKVVGCKNSLLLAVENQVGIVSCASKGGIPVRYALVLVVHN